MHTALNYIHILYANMHNCNYITVNICTYIPAYAIMATCSGVVNMLACSKQTHCMCYGYSLPTELYQTKVLLIYCIMQRACAHIHTGR